MSGLFIFFDKPKLHIYLEFIAQDIKNNIDLTNR
jgi:hypothetical protein